MNRSMHKFEMGIAIAQTLRSFEAPVRRAVINNPEHAAGVVIGRPCHDLLHQTIKGSDTIFGLTTSEDSGVVDIQARKRGPGAATEIFVLNPAWECPVGNSG